MSHTYTHQFCFFAKFNGEVELVCRSRDIISRDVDFPAQFSEKVNFPRPTRQFSLPAKLSDFGGNLVSPLVGQALPFSLYQ